MNILITFFKYSIILLSLIALNSCDKKPEERNSIALNYLIEGDTSKAIKQFNQATQDKPDYFEVILNRAKIYSAINNYDAALFDFDKVLTLQENNFDAIKGRGVVYLKMKQFELAIRDFNSALKINNSDANLFLFRAYSFFEIDLLLMACEDWQRASELGSEEAKRYFDVYCSQILD